MTWVRIDDAFFDHPKTVEVGPCAAYLFLAGLAYCNRFLTDGVIPRQMVGNLVDFSEVRVRTRDGEGRVGPGIGASIAANVLVDRLLTVGYWTLNERGDAVVHDYHKYQPVRAEVMERRDALSQVRARAGRKGGRRSGESRRGSKPVETSEANNEANEANGKPHPSPVGTKAFTPARTSGDEGETSQAKPKTRVRTTRNPDGSSSSQKVRVPDGLVVARMSPGTGWVWQDGFHEEDFDL